MRRTDYADLKKRLLQFYSPEEADRWMRSPHPQLEGRRAVDSGYYEVRRIIERLESGAFV